MARTLRDAVVVITGASSGIGRAAALGFAEAKASVVLAARREDVLGEVASSCRTRGGRALVVPTDVTDPGAVEALARQTVEAFGRIDVWVNNAGVTLFARVEEAPYAAYRRVLDTNLLGAVHGARAAIPYLREQGEGVLINNASAQARAGAPYVSAYAISKFGVRALGECLRGELADEPDIHVCTVLPSSMDTPLFQHGANYTGRAAKPIPPVYPASRAANAIVGLARAPRREITVGMAGRALAWQRAIAPGRSERMVARAVERDHFSADPAAPTDGNLFEPSSQHAAVSGEWRRVRRSRARLAGAAALAVGAPVVAAVLARRRAPARRRRRWGRR